MQILVKRDMYESESGRIILMHQIDMTILYMVLNFKIKHIIINYSRMIAVEIYFFTNLIKIRC